MGFNAMRPGKIGRADLLMLVAAVAVVAALVAWVVR